MHSACRVLLSVSLLGGGSTALAQHLHHHHNHGHVTPWHHHHVLVDPHGHRVVAHHDSYRHVIPAQPRFQGTYYTYQNAHYYYPSPVVTAQNSVAPQPVAVEFGGFAHVDDLAARLEDMANQLCLDLHYNYQHNPGFAETYGEAYQILQAAQWAHAKEHQQDREGLARTLGPMDDLFHHVQQDVQGWQRTHRRQIGQLGIVDKMANMEDLIHHLMHEIGVRPSHDRGDEIAPPPGGALEQAPPPAGGIRPLGPPPAPGRPLSVAPPQTIP
ncbi:hypothetical protein [Planctomyces sp. SH-PL14]|uniref:hypothetical protein n=1 Tax=Planctomyces sp. SH-PL14 TaxID=1632864 RepID=UPI00078B97B2|nr:hypothetical protein [Planctomyces sp. SH-PL14]AMV20190.1 hypothetical protein VT03_20000 [Planctomyces sp. SH-PL14]